MRSKMLKASLVIAAAAGATVVATEPVSAAGKVQVVFCKKNGQEAYFKDGTIAKEHLKFCDHKAISSADALKIKNSNPDFFLKFNAN
jgi:hypothetical protein